MKTWQKSKYEVFPSSRFKKDYKKFPHRKKLLAEIQDTIHLLVENGHEAIPANKKPHKLTGNYEGCWECHAMPDLLIIWEQYEDTNQIVLIRTGSHPDLF